MTTLNRTTLRGILARITSVDPKYIVPKEGRWWNPQNLRPKPHTWCAFNIRSKVPRTVPFFHSDDGQTQNAAVEMLATIDLQFVGPQAEDIASTVCLWPMREDVKEAFQEIRGAILPDNLGAVTANFYQDGDNNVQSWNVQIRVLYFQFLETTLERVKTIDL